MQHRRQRLPALVIAASLVALGNASADTIYLENGRVIYAAETKEVGDRLEFTQFGARQSIPLERVERVVEDDRSDPSHRRPVRGLLADPQALLTGVLPTILGQLGAAGSGSPSVDTGGLDLEKIPAILPLVLRLGELLGAQDPSPQAAGALGQQLLSALREVGISDAMIRVKASEWGIDLAALSAGSPIR